MGKNKRLAKNSQKSISVQFLFVLCRAVFICVFPGFCLVRLPLSRAVYAIALAQTRLLLGILHSNRFYNWHFDDFFVYVVFGINFCPIAQKPKVKWNCSWHFGWMHLSAWLDWIGLDWVSWSVSWITLCLH